jgi:hypothetical protein
MSWYTIAVVLHVVVAGGRSATVPHAGVVTGVRTGVAAGVAVGGHISHAHVLLWSRRRVSSTGRSRDR